MESQAGNAHVLQYNCFPLTSVRGHCVGQEPHSSTWPSPIHRPQVYPRYKYEVQPVGSRNNMRSSAYAITNRYYHLQLWSQAFSTSGHTVKTVSELSLGRDEDNKNRIDDLSKTKGYKWLHGVNLP